MAWSGVLPIRKLVSRFLRITRAEAVIGSLIGGSLWEGVNI